MLGKSLALVTAAPLGNHGEGVAGNMNKTKLVILASGLSLGLGACADMMGHDDTTMEPAAGPMHQDMGEESGLSESGPGDMMDSDDQEGAGSDDTGSAR